MTPSMAQERQRSRDRDKAWGRPILIPAFPWGPGQAKPSRQGQRPHPATRPLPAHHRAHSLSSSGDPGLTQPLGPHSHSRDVEMRRTPPNSGQRTNSPVAPQSPATARPQENRPGCGQTCSSVRIHPSVRKSRGRGTCSAKARGTRRPRALQQRPGGQHCGRMWPPACLHPPVPCDPQNKPAAGVKQDCGPRG